MSTLITPPDRLDDHNDYLLVNATHTDVEMIIHWLRTNQHDYTINLYYDSMLDALWLKEAAAISDCILVHDTDTSKDTITDLSTQTDKLIAFGPNSQHKMAIGYLIEKNKQLVDNYIKD